MLRGITEAGRLGKWGWAYKKQRPKSQLPCLQGAPSHCLQRKGPGTPGHGCSLTYRAAPIPTAGRGSFSPSPGHLDPHPANGAVTPHRLPAEHKRSRTQTLITGGWTTPLEPQSSVSPPAAGTTLSSQAAGRHGQRPQSGSQPQLPGRAQAQAHTSQPRASERPGPHSHPSTGGGGGLSEHRSPSTHGGHAQPCLQDRTPAPHPLQEAPRSTRLPPTPELQAGPPGSSRTSPTSSLGEPREQPRPTERGGHPTRKQHLNLHPLTGQGGVIPTSWMAKAAGCNAAASPHLSTGRAGGLLKGQRAPKLGTHTPTTGLPRRQQNRRPRKDRPKPWLQGGLGHTTTAWL